VDVSAGQFVIDSRYCNTEKGRGMNTQKVKARRLTGEEVATLDVNDKIFISADMDGLPLDCFAPAFLTQPGKDFEGGAFTAESAYGETLSFLPDNQDEQGAWIEDGKGQEIEVLQSAGVLLKLALFVPEGGGDSRDKLYSAVREQFGEGIVQRWQEDVVNVPDVKIDLFEEPVKIRKGSAPTRDRRAMDIYPTRAQFLEPTPGWKLVKEQHRPVVDDTPTI
jgi:hypothetical protein